MNYNEKKGFLCDTFGARVFPKTKDALVKNIKTGTTKKLTYEETCRTETNFFDNPPIESNGTRPDILCEGNLTVTYKTEAEGKKLANKFKNLANNPACKLNIKFVRIWK